LPGLDGSSTTTLRRVLPAKRHFSAVPAVNDPFWMSSMLAPAG